MADFLLEIGCEEIPARMIDGARQELAKRVGELLTRERLSGSPALEPYSTPRRIAVLARGIAVSQPDAEEQVMGPAVKVAFKDGQPMPPAHAFAKKVGLDLSQVEKVTTPKGEYLSAKVVKKGRSASEILSEALPKEIAGLYWAKNMYWRPGKTSERFVRPVRWVVAMLDGQTVPMELFGTSAGNESEGHRILSGGAVKLASPAAYQEGLLSANVVASPAEREHRIRKALDAATRKVAGARWREDKELLETVVNLTEFPSVILGNFDPEFLALPEEVLVTVMRDHQKYFAVEDANGKLAPHFLAVLNTSGDPQGLIQHGNERVLRARFNDARFFWEVDQKHPLRERVQWLKSVTFQKDLGSYADKTRRVQALASQICEWLNDGREQKFVREGVVHKAALLAKTDLTTELVKEFTELQGIVGGLYARVQQLDPALPEATRYAIADVIYDQYKPGSMDDAVPRSVEGGVVSIADKADSIAGMFALGLIPSGSKDPFALRRQANGIVKIIAEQKLNLCISDVFRVAREQYAGSDAEKKFKSKNYTADIEGFFRERLEFYLREVRGFAYDVVNAVLAAGADDINDAIARAEAVAQVRGSEDFQAIGAAFKRIKNILRQANEKKIAPAETFDPAVSTEYAEKALASVMANANSAIAGKKGDYVGALQEIAKVRQPVDLFFDKVMVMVDDQQVRANRLALLRDLLGDFSTIADFSEIVTERK
ncbi:MAG TPA: glycine--tRNA ligase subunit beta [Terriglobales bacterium]|nr:glycine--tRNA ligase subunit beta [Terriglobales bacterium]